ncbi:hypothetical protein DSO57_1000639 [Entomophthora muscae]|uniref:Uncharacterized protein n=1 Tax=Entomophthora muscae TaxID=34485 RepID=A0ACC2S0F1_9FUNG|nr:hypothetical protein DSO57_1000639 [Entomophthora muscae]
MIISDSINKGNELLLPGGLTMGKISGASQFYQPHEIERHLRSSPGTDYSPLPYHVSAEHCSYYHSQARAVTLNTVSLAEVAVSPVVAHRLVGVELLYLVRYSPFIYWALAAGYPDRGVEELPNGVTAHLVMANINVPGNRAYHCSEFKGL